MSDDDQEMMRITQRQGRCLKCYSRCFFFFSCYPEFGVSIGLSSIFLSMSVGFFVSAIPKDAHRLAQLQLKRAFASLGFVFSFNLFDWLASGKPHLGVNLLYAARESRGKDGLY